jgi:uncharacterized protein YacL
VWQFRAKKFVFGALVPIFGIIVASALTSSIVLRYVDNLYIELLLVLLCVAVSIFTIGLTAAQRQQIWRLFARKKIA